MLINIRVCFPRKEILLTGKGDTLAYLIALVDMLATCAEVILTVFNTSTWPMYALFDHLYVSAVNS